MVGFSISERGLLEGWCTGRLGVLRPRLVFHRILFRQLSREDMTHSLPRVVEASEDDAEAAQQDLE